MGRAMSTATIVVSLKGGSRKRFTAPSFALRSRLLPGDLVPRSEERRCSLAPSRRRRRRPARSKCATAMGLLYKFSLSSTSVSAETMAARFALSVSLSRLLAVSFMPPSPPPSILLLSFTVIELFFSTPFRSILKCQSGLV